jgi:hypothetical protein
MPNREFGELSETFRRAQELQALDDALVERDQFVFGEFRQVDGHVAKEYISQRGRSSSPAPSFQQPVHALPHPRSRRPSVDAFREERIVVRFGVP